MRRPSQRTGVGVAVIVALVAFEGFPGLIIGLTLAVALHRQVRARTLVGIAFGLFVAVPLSMFAQGLVAPGQLTPQIVPGYGAANLLAFAGFAYLATGVLIDAWARSHRVARPAGNSALEGSPLIEDTAMADDRTPTPPGAPAFEPAVARARDHLSQVIDQELGAGAPLDDELVLQAASTVPGSVAAPTMVVGPLEPAHLVRERSADGAAPADGSRGTAGDRAREATRSPIVRGAVWMLISVAIQGLTGAGFWVIASHWYAQSDVGLASALFSHVLLITFLTGMGLVVTVPLFAYRSDEADAVTLAWAFLYTTMTSFVGSAVYLVVIHGAAADLLRDRMGVLAFVVFALVTAGTSMSTIADVRLMAERRWRWVLGRNTLVGFGRIFLLAIPAFGNRALWLFLVGVLPAAISGAIAVGLIPRICHIRYRLSPIPSRMWEGLRFATINWFSILVSQGPSFLVPVIVAVKVSDSDNAKFFLAWSAASLIFVIPTTMSQVLLAESPKRGQNIRTKVLESLGLSLLLVMAALVASVVLRSLVIAVYGQSYQQIADLLPVLILAGVPWSFTAIGLALARIRHDQFIVLCTTITAGLAVVGFTLMLVDAHGAAGAATAWLCGHTVAAVTMALSSLVSSRIRRRGHAPAIFGLAEGEHDLDPEPVEELISVGESGVTVLGGDQVPPATT